MNPQRSLVSVAAGPRPGSALGRAATLALYDELALAPKPGLVSLVDSGSHHDMDAQTFVRSMLALRGYFVRIAELGAAHAGFGELERCGQQAEARMLAATGGVNTHRGAIFALGLLCAAAGAAGANGARVRADDIRATLLHRWGDALAERCDRTPSLPGGLAARRHGLRSASQEAALGMPVLFETVLPAWADARAAGLGGERLKLQVFFATLGVLDDSNLAHRGGLAGLQHARAQACRFFELGGAACDAAVDHAWAVHRSFVARRLSPGGCADLLAAACFLQRIGAIA
ncbi:MAG TPA: triphosphoribosyl-dephospho-CoA synthase [Burkholderiaceae bacterium]|nr:triphosphoribosyl-dephospho-CoA synthase [Burkholderiaceae bacterium]